MSNDGKVTARTTFTPDIPIVMDESEYHDLRRQGLIVDTAPVADDVSDDGPEPEKPKPAPRGK